MDGSQPTVIFKRTKSKQKQQRTRETSPDNNDQQDSPSTLAAKLKNKNKKSRPQARLSFGAADNDEESGEEFKVKKSNLSQKIGLNPSTTIPSTFTSLDKPSLSTQSSRPTYDQAYLNELKASTPSGRPGNVDESYSYDTSMDLDSGDAYGQTIDVEDTLIPSESSIKTAREKRERLRKTGASNEEDFISLSLTRKEDMYQGPHPESRLMREDDELGEGDDEFAEYTSAQERIAIGKKSRKAEAGKLKANMIEQIADAEEEDEETREWEQEQLRRGGLRTPDRRSPSRKEKPVYKPAPIPPSAPVPTLEKALGRLAHQLSQLTTTHASNTSTLTSLAQQRTEVDERENELREMVERAEEKRAWFEEFREWIEGVAGFLDEKYPMVEKLEDEHISLLEERHSMTSSRRQADDEDDLATIFGTLPLPPSEDPEVEETDDLGRVVPKPDPKSLRYQRQAQRSARHAKHLTRKSSQQDDDEGYSTDSSLRPGDETSYREALSSLIQRRKNVLSDVRAEEFRDPSKIKKFADWRQRYQDIYVGAYGNLGVVSIWEFWARLEMAGWDFIEDARSLDSFEWYHGLYQYCRPNGEEEGIGLDGDLVESMICTAVLPRMAKVVGDGKAVDVYSGKDVRRLVDLAEEIEASINIQDGEKRHKFDLLIRAGTTLFSNEISQTESMIDRYIAHFGGSSSAKGFNPQAIPCRQRFIFRRIKLLQSLLRWRRATGEKFGIGALATRLVDNCIVRMAEGGWEIGGHGLVRQAADMLPKELVSKSLLFKLS